jgi:hypothetical protein
MLDLHKRSITIEVDRVDFKTMDENIFVTAATCTFSGTPVKLSCAVVPQMTTPHHDRHILMALLSVHAGGESLLGCAKPNSTSLIWPYPLFTSCPCRSHRLMWAL